MIDFEPTEDGTYQAPALNKVNDAITVANQGQPDTEPEPDPDPPKPKKTKAPEKKEKVESAPWDYQSYKNQRTGDGKTTGFAAYVNANADSFHEQSEERQDVARKKWAALYGKKPFPLGPVEEEPVKENPAEPEPEPEEMGQADEVEYVKIYGVEIAEGFERKVYPHEIDKWLVDIWEHPSKYNDQVKDNSEQAFYRFLKFLWVKYPDGSEKRLVDTAAVRQEKYGTEQGLPEEDQTPPEEPESGSEDAGADEEENLGIDPDGLYECPNAGGAQVNGQSCIDCQYQIGCPGLE